MKNSHAWPGLIAQVDQLRAKDDHRLDHLIADYRAHAARHDGETVCAYSQAYVDAITRHPGENAALLAVAIARIAQLVEEGTTR